MKKLFLGAGAAALIGVAAMVSLSTPSLASPSGCVDGCWARYHSCMYSCGNTSNYHCSSACSSAKDACVDRC